MKTKILKYFGIVFVAIIIAAICTAWAELHFYSYRFVTIVMILWLVLSKLGDE